MLDAEEIEIGGEKFPNDSVHWVSINEYWRMEKSEPDENGFISFKNIPVIIIIGTFGHREFIGVEPNITNALQLKSAIQKKNGLRR